MLVANANPLGAKTSPLLGFANLPKTSVLPIDPNASPVLLRRYGALESSRSHGVPFGSRSAPLPENPLGGVALLLTNQAVASNVPFATKCRPQLVASSPSSERYDRKLALTRVLHLIAVIYPIGDALNSFCLS